jgi:hypothetical protein
MWARRVLLIQTLTAAISLISNIADANIWNAFHVNKDDENQDQNRKMYEETDGYGVDVVRREILCIRSSDVFVRDVESR